MVRTDNKWKNFKYRYEVPQKILDSQFNYQNPDNEDEECPQDGYFEYKNSWYHLDNFIYIDENNPLAKDGWGGFHPDSAFSAVVIKVSKCGEQYMVGTYIS